MSIVRYNLLSRCILPQFYQNMIVKAMISKKVDIFKFLLRSPFSRSTNHSIFTECITLVSNGVFRPTIWLGQILTWRPYRTAGTAGQYLPGWQAAPPRPYRRNTRSEGCSTAFRSQVRASQVGKLPVHIPFDIGNIRTPQDLHDTFINIVHHFLPVQIQRILFPALGRCVSGYLDSPVRMHPVQVGIQ